MNSFVKFIAMIALVLNAVACTRSSQSGEAAPTAPPQKAGPEGGLPGKSFDDVLLMKYDRAVLTCNLWAQYGAALDKTVAPIESISIDLKRADATKKWELKSEDSERKVVIAFEITALKIMSGEVRALDKSTYHLQYAPQVEINYIKEETVYSSGETPYASRSQQATSIFEKVPDRTINFSYQPVGSSGKYFTVVECLLDTQAKPEYQDQFSVEKNN